MRGRVLIGARVMVFLCFLYTIYFLISCSLVSANSTDQSTVSLNVGSALDLNLSANTVSLNLVPASGAVFGSNNIVATVGTNNSTGYNLIMSANQTSLTYSDAVPAGTQLPTIETLDSRTGGYTESTFTTNRWGVKYDTANYYPFQTNMLVSYSDTPINNVSKTITFAAKVDAAKPAGLYTLLLDFAITARRALETYDINLIAERYSVADQYIFILPDTNNPTTIQEEGTATLNFTASGGLLTKAAFDTVNANMPADFNYSVNSDRTSATLTISNPTGDIDVNLMTGYTVYVSGTVTSGYPESETNTQMQFLRAYGDDFYTPTFYDSDDSGSVTRVFTNIVAIKPQTNYYIEVIDSNDVIHGFDTGIYILEGNSRVEFSRVRNCIDQETLITMADGSLKKMGEIEVGDEVLSVDWNNKKLVSRKVIYSGRDEPDYDEWYVNAHWENLFSDGTIIRQAMNHRFYNLESQSFVHLKNWTPGQKTYKIDGTNPSLVSRTYVQGKIYYARITLEDDNNYFANGLLTGDSESQAGIPLTEVLEILGN